MKAEGNKYPKKFKGDWALVGKTSPNSKPNDPIIGHPAMKGRRWTIDYGYDSHKTFSKLKDSLKEYEEIENGDDWNISSKSKGDLDYLTPKSTMKYRDFFDQGDEWTANLQQKTKKINEEIRLAGGIGDATAKSDVKPHELAMGVAVEMAEHTHDEKIATEIALDHLTEDPDYYTKLNQAGLTKEFSNISPTGYGDPTSTFNQSDRLGNTVTCGPGNNIVGGMDKTPDGLIDGKNDSRPLVDKGSTVDIDVKEPEFNDLKEAVMVEKKKGGKRKPKPTNPSLWSRAKSAARAKFDVYPSAYANGWAAKWYKKHGGGWRMG